MSVGCVSPWWNAFLSPHEVGNFRENRVNEIQRTISFRDKPVGIPGAVDPTPEDLVATIEEYKIGPGDALSIRLMDFFRLGAESELTPVVDELGYIDIPQLGWIYVEGMTPRQLQAQVGQLAKDAGIYPADIEPTVLVQMLSRQQRMYNVSGAVQAPGAYPVLRPDFRLREAINLAGGLNDAIRTIYVFRNAPRETRVVESAMPQRPDSLRGTDRPEPGTTVPRPPRSVTPEPAGPNDAAAPAPPVSPNQLPISMSEFDGSAGSPASAQRVAGPQAGHRRANAFGADGRRRAGPSRPARAGAAEGVRGAPGVLMLAQAPTEEEFASGDTAAGDHDSGSPDEREAELMDAVAPATIPAVQHHREPNEASAGEDDASTPARLPTYIFVNGEFVEAPSATTREAAVRAGPATVPMAQEPAPWADDEPVEDTQPPAAEPWDAEPWDTEAGDTEAGEEPVGGGDRPAGSAPEYVDWEELASEGKQRVIRISAEKLKSGDPSVNIVIRHQDWIQLDQGTVGVFYLMGHVLRPGVYSLTGQEITLTQAVAAAGGLDQVAWPTRCEIRRRIDGDREEITQWDLARIMAGLDPDLFLKKEDVINVGTHAVAPLLAAIRNSFRMTYGFGFVYDRNFADIDAVGPQTNPKTLRQIQRQQLGLLN